MDGLALPEGMPFLDASFPRAIEAHSLEVYSSKKSILTPDICRRVFSKFVTNCSLSLMSLGNP